MSELAGPNWNDIEDPTELPEKLRLARPRLCEDDQYNATLKHLVLGEAFLANS